MTNPTKVSARLKDSKGIYLKHMKNVERSTSGEIGNFSCGNEEHITKLTALKSWLLQRINTDDKKGVKFYHKKIRIEEISVLEENISVLEDLGFELLAIIKKSLRKTPPASSLNLSLP